MPQKVYEKSIVCDCLGIALHKLANSDIASARLVSRAWNETIAHSLWRIDPSNWESLSAVIHCFPYVSTVIVKDVYLTVYNLCTPLELSRLRHLSLSARRVAHNRLDCAVIFEACKTLPLKKLELSGFILVNPIALTSFQGLTSIALTECCFIDGLCATACLPKVAAYLKGLTLTGEAASTIQSLDYYSRLEYLDITPTAGNDISRQVAKLPLLKHLDVSHLNHPADGFGDEDVMQLKNALVSLSVTLHKEATDDCVRYISHHLSGLTCLKLGNSRPGSTITEIEQLGKLTALEALCLDNLTVLHTACCALATLHGLSTLSFTNCEGLDDSDLFALSKLTQLKVLRLRGCLHVSDIGLSMMMKRCSMIEKLDISCCDNVTNTGLAAMSSLDALKCLDIAHCEKLTDAGIQAFFLKRNLSFLEELTLTDCRFSNTAIDLLADHAARIRSLNIEYCTLIDDRSLALLITRFPFLVKLHIFRSGITSAGVAEAQQKKSRIMSIYNNKHYWWHRPSCTSIEAH